MTAGDTSFTFLETPRLMIRRFKPQDLKDFAAYRNHPEVARYQSWSTYTLEDAKKLFNEMKNINPALPGRWFQFVIEEKQSKKIIGDCGLKVHEKDDKQADIGYTLANEFQGKGYATEAIQRILEYCFEVLKLHRVTATTDVLNDSSVRLLKRVGFRQEGHFIENIFFKGAWGDEYLFAMLSAEWKKPRVRGLSVKE
jgi:RimJ/RimL family protein N-acetyltransferase